MSVPGLRREDFPVMDRLTYLNTASAGLVPAVGEALRTPRQPGSAAPSRRWP